MKDVSKEVILQDKINYLIIIQLFLDEEVH